MTSDEYLERIEKQRKWYSDKSTKNKKYYQYSSIIKMILVALIPVVSLIKYDFKLYAYLVPLLSFGALITEGIQTIFQYKDNWINYRATSEKLKKEISLYKTKSGAYKTTPELSNYNLFVECCENIISEENTVWIDNTSKIEVSS